ncbi:Regulator of telomere elongation helicase 1 like protein, partial [Dictyocoela roeselum]
MTITLYPSQKDFITKATQIIENEEIGIFSSPTGTGKTISLLSSVLQFDNTVFYTSRTHVQLQQAMRELRRLSDVDAVILGSRRVYCINDRINRLEPDVINDKCRDMIKNRECQYYINSEFNGSFGIDKSLDVFFREIGDKNRNPKLVNSCEDKMIYCPNISQDSNKLFESVKKNIINNFESHQNDSKSKNVDFMDFSILEPSRSKNFVDIEDFKAAGRKDCFCPYFAAKEISKNSKIVFLPYTLLFSKEGRRSADINTRDAIIIVDEAHNLYSALISINSVVLSSLEMRRFCAEMKRRVEKSRKKSEALRKIDIVLLETIQSILKFINGKPESAISVNEFLLKLDIYNFNFIEISDHIHNPEIKSFFYLLTYSDENCWVFYCNEQIKITPMDPSIYLETLDFKSIILAGGTMEPIDQIKTLFKREIKYFSFPSICMNFKSLILTSGPSKNVKLNFENTNDAMIVECLVIVNNLSVAVKTG